MGIMRMVEMMIATRIQIEKLIRIQLNFKEISKLISRKLILTDLVEVCSCGEGHNFSKVRIFNCQR